MKKVLYVFQAFILIVVLIKVATLCGCLQFLDLPQSSLLSENRALAEPSRQRTAIQDVTEDEQAQPRSLMSALQKRQQELEGRENALRSEEERLASLKKEVTEKIDVLLRLEQKLNAAIGANKEAEAKRYKDLAKVYEAAPPAKAGAMLEKLDLKTAAGITLHMKRDKAGAIWGFLSPQKAVEITREITMTAPKPQE